MDEMGSTRDGFDVGRLVRLLAGLVLLMAAGLKILQLATEPVNNCGDLSCRWMSIVEAEVELLLGAWLAGRLAARWAHRVAMLAFAAFAAVALLKVLAGDLNCGCFGQVELSPWFSLTLDVAVVAGLWVTRQGVEQGARDRSGQPHAASPARGERGSGAWRRVVLLVLVGVAAVASLVAMLRFEPARMADDGQVAGDARAVLLEPVEWRGQRWAMLSHVDIADRISRGDWLVVLYRSRCPVCRVTVHRLAEQGRANVAVIELPRAGFGPDIVPSGSKLVVGRMVEGHTWFAPTPLLVRLQDGKVVGVEQGK